MAFNVENGSGSALDIDDLGITLETGEITDLSLRGDVQNIINSAQAGEEISNLISAGDLIVKDPFDGVTDLSIANGLVCARSYADPNYRVGAGARIGDISDVTLTTPANTQVLTYDNGVWINSAGGGSTQDLYETFAGDTGTPTTASSPTDTLTITGGTNIATVASADTITVNGANIWNTMAGDSGSTTPNIALDTFTIAGGTGITTAVAGDTLTITSDAPNIVQNLWETITADSGSAVANIATDTLTIAGGTGISTAIVGDVLTISTGVGDVPAALARRTTAMPITDSFVTITFDTTDFENDDTVVDHDDVTNTSRITVKESGSYEIFFQTSGLEFTADAAGFYTIETRLIKNGVLVAVPGANILSSGYTGGAATTSEVNAPSTNIILDLAANDYLEVQIRYIVLNGVTGTVGSATSDSTFWVAKMSGAKGDDGATGAPGSGSTINVYEEGTIVPNSPFSEFNFIGDLITATDAGSGRVDVTVTGGTSPSQLVSEAVSFISAATVVIPSSNTYVDIPGATLDITTSQTGYIEVWAGFNGLSPGDTELFNCRYVINGVNYDPILMRLETANLRDNHISVRSATTFPAGTYTVKLQLANTANANNATVENFHMMANSLGITSGPAGADGVDGKTVLNGTVDPTTEGQDGDFYINTTTDFIFGPKTGGVWGSGTSLVGPQGPTGSGSTINVYEEGIIVPNSPFDRINFIGDNVVATDGGTGQVDVTIEGGGKMDRQAIVETTPFFTTSTTDVDITNTSLSTKDLGETGTYIINFTAEVAIQQKNQPATFSLNVGGSVVRSLKQTGVDKNAEWQIMTITHEQSGLANGTIIKAQVRTNNGDDLEIDSRELIIDGIADSNVVP